MTTFGNGKFRYRLEPDWEQRPDGWGHPDVSDVAIDKDDRVFLLMRSEWPVVIYEPGGEFLRTWGRGEFELPHGISIDPNDRVWVVDRGGHVAKTFDLEGAPQMTLGDGRPSDTGMTDDFQTIKRGGPPFNQPTNVAFGPSGDAYIGDGYGNARIHRFEPQGNLLFSWGEPGSGKAQFNIPHAVAVDGEGRVFVADRENDRIQIFSPEGALVDIWEEDLCRPDDIAIRDGLLYVVELGLYVGRYPGLRSDTPSDPPSRISIWTLDRKLVTRWGTRDSCTPGNFHAPHGVAVDSQGNIYVTECIWSGGANAGQVPADCHSVQKFTRV
jgi:DNA-binding beta-propeller fold protein YncE